MSHDTDDTGNWGFAPGESEYDEGEHVSESALVPVEEDPGQALARPEDFDADEFFRTDTGTTLVGPEDLEAAVPDEEKPFLEEVERYWLNKPYTFSVIYHSKKENEKRYFAVEPHLKENEQDLREFLDEQVRQEIDWNAISTEATRQERIDAIQKTLHQLLRRYRMISRADLLDEEAGYTRRAVQRVAEYLEQRADKKRGENEDGDDERIQSAPTPRDEHGDPTTLTGRQVDKLTYYLIRDRVGFSSIDPLKHDINIEDISADRPNVEVFVDHTRYEKIITNVSFTQAELDRFVKRLANSAGYGISRRDPLVDAVLEDGSRAQLTFSNEATAEGSNFTIRQFMDIPFTPIDLINWETYSLDQMAYLWLVIEQGRSVIFAGGTASGKTTTQNAVSLFIPASRSKIVSIEDTPELVLPQKNWIQSLTRSSVSKSGMDAIEEYDLLETGLRQRPTYIIMGEVRGEEGRTLFQAMSSGHHTMTTFHANNPQQVVQRFSTDPINVKKPYFNELDLICLQSEKRVNGNKVRRSTQISEVGEYVNRAENGDVRDEVQQHTAYKWDAATDEFQNWEAVAGDGGNSCLLEDIRQSNGWTEEELEEELQKRKVVLAYLVTRGINDYGGVAGTIQAFLAEPDDLLALIAQDQLEDYFGNFLTMKSVDIDVDPEAEELVPRPDPSEQVRERAEATLDDAEGLLNEYRKSSTDDAFGGLFTPRDELEAETAADVDGELDSRVSENAVAVEPDPEEVEDDADDEPAGTADGEENQDDTVNDPPADDSEQGEEEPETVEDVDDGEGDVPGEDHCAQYLDKKGRYCTLSPQEDSEFCHLHPLKGDIEDPVNQDGREAVDEDEERDEGEDESPLEAVQNGEDSHTDQFETAEMKPNSDEAADSGAEAEADREEEVDTETAEDAEDVDDEDGWNDEELDTLFAEDD